MQNFYINLSSVLHIRSFGETLITFLTTIFFSIFAYHKQLYIDNNLAFNAMWAVVWIDWFFGVWRSKKIGKFETQKALKVVYYSVSYTLMLYVILQVEKGYPSAFWMSEAIVMPILTFQIISILKNISLLGYIPQGLLLEILNKIDNYKEETLTNTISNQNTENNGTST